MNPTSVDASTPRRRACVGLVKAATWGLALSSSLSLLPLVARAGASGPEGVAPALIDAASVLKRVQEGVQKHSYTGTYVVSAGGTLTSARIVHLGEGRDQIERIDALDGQMRQLFRHNELVHLLWPKSHEARVQARDPVGDFPAPPLPAGTPHAVGMYEAQILGADRVAGQDAQVIAFKPRDNQRYAQRWWLERSSQLLLRVDMLNERGETLESAAFSELQLGTKVSAAQLLQQMHKLDGLRVLKTATTRTSLDREGWSMRSNVPGFEGISCVRRPALAQTASEPVPTAAPNSDSTLSPEAKTLVQAIYSDGLTHVSLFIEPFNAELHRSEAPVVMGATHALARRAGDWWITAVGDVPTATLKQLAGGLERRAKP